jgi:hypothetical protein
MRRLTLNLLTSAATLVLLAALSVPAARVLAPRASAQAPRDHLTAAAPRRLPDRTFGVYVDPWHVDTWASAIGAAPQMVAKFEAFSRDRPIDNFLAETERQGIRQVLVTWEPWEPVPASLGTLLQYLPQPGYRNGEIARGVQDAYIARFARSLATFDGIVWVRYAHEMNSFWYPWARGPRNYRRAWRHVVSVVRGAGARNVRFVWSPNSNLYESQAKWLRGMRQYWPGARWVDAVGSTVINFGGRKRYAAGRFVPRLRALHRVYGRPVILTETNTEYHGRLVWLRAMRAALRRMPWVEAVVWSQLPSRGTAQMRTGRLDWDVQRDPASAALLRGIIEDGRP